jgi:hypothetical protein
VRVDASLYVRGYNGVTSRWYQAALKQRAGRIIAAGLTKEVAFVPVEEQLTIASTMHIGRSTREAHILRR